MCIQHRTMWDFYLERTLNKQTKAVQEPSWKLNTFHNDSFKDDFSIRNEQAKMIQEPPWKLNTIQHRTMWDFYLERTLNKLRTTMTLKSLHFLGWLLQLKCIVYALFASFIPITTFELSMHYRVWVLFGGRELLVVSL